VRNIDLIQIQQCYEKQVILRGGHEREREREVVKVNMVDVLYIIKYKNFKPVEITI
jgi:hypothetical protein